MSEYYECPHCGGRVERLFRFGVWLSLPKVRILDAIMASDEGVPLPGLCERLGITYNCLKVQVCQINDMIEDSGWKIVCIGRMWRGRQGSRPRARNVRGTGYRLVPRNETVDKSTHSRLPCAPGSAR
jgi:hypothetical protein